MNKKERQWTEEQKRLIDVDGRGWPALARVAVLADAGSGKTSVLEARAKAIMGARPEDRLLCVSFTERSAADLKTRFADYPAAEVHTIHGFCARILRTHGAALRLPPLWRVLDETESGDLLYASFVKVFRREPPQSEDFSADQWLTSVRKCASGRHREGKPLLIEGRVAETFINAVLADFDDAKERQCALEYGDLECKAAELLAQGRFQSQVRARYHHVFVDEFQDTSIVQCDLVRRLAGPEQSLFVVGDSKQSIYRFRGADVAVFEAFVEELPAQQRLSLNFRSRPVVIDAVNATFTPVMKHYGAMQAARPDGGKVARFEAPAEQHAAVIHGIIAELEKNGTPLSSIALLLPRLRGEAPGKMLARLRERGVGIALGSAGGAQQNPSLQALIRLWIWACEPRHEVFAAAAAVQLLGVDRGEIREGLQRFAPPQGPLTCAELLAWLDERFALAAGLGIFYEQFRVFILNLQHQGLSPAACAHVCIKPPEDDAPANPATSDDESGRE
jgi:superfamily I DNA/RNA helicase